MDASVSIRPHAEAAALIRGKAVVARNVYFGLLPELRGRAFTVSGMEGAQTLQRIRDEIASLAMGGETGTWDRVKERLAADLDSHLGAQAEQRATVLLRLHGFAAFQASAWRVAQEDEDTTHLQYLATEDDRVRDAHLALNGIVLPKDDPFWDRHYPPWEWGCRCRVRPMNADLVAAERRADEGRNPEDRNVIEGPVLSALRQGTLMRGPRRWDVSAPSERASAGDAFRWHPDDLRLPLGELQLRYDAPTWADFEQWARRQQIGRGTVWAWLMNRPRWTQGRDQGARARLDRGTIQKQVEKQSRTEEAENEYANAEVHRHASQRFFAGGQEAFGGDERIWGAGLDDESIRDLKIRWGAELAAAATGRKPLFHEAIGESAPRIAMRLRQVLPASVEVRATGTDLFVYRPGALIGLADPSRPLWEQVRAHSDDGRWLGYGAHFPTEPTVRVSILNPEGRVVAGFRAPASAPDGWANARAEDFTIATGRRHTARILEP